MKQTALLRNLRAYIILGVSLTICGGEGLTSPSAISLLNLGEIGPDWIFYLTRQHSIHPKKGKGWCRYRPILVQPNLNLHPPDHNRCPLLLLLLLRPTCLPFSMAGSRPRKQPSFTGNGMRFCWGGRTAQTPSVTGSAAAARPPDAIFTRRIKRCAAAAEPPRVSSRSDQTGSVPG